MFKFFIFSLICLVILVFSVMVITVINPVHSVLFLILVFINAAILLILLEIEFLALMFIIIYVGAIAILFLFVVMMLDLKISTSFYKYLRYLSIGGFLGSVCLITMLKSNEFNIFFISNLNSYCSTNFQWNFYLDFITNIECLGQFMYTFYFLQFISAGLILLVGMIGAIVLTLIIQPKQNSKIQDIYNQLSRNLTTSFFLIKINKYESKFTTPI